MNTGRSVACAARGDVSGRYTGEVRIVAPFGRDGSPRGATFAFHPRTRTARHTHSMGRTLLVAKGLGRLPRAGGQIKPMRPGDLIWLEPGRKQWHGAAPDQPLRLIALARPDPEAQIVWMEHVRDDEYCPPEPARESNDE